MLCCAGKLPLMEIVFLLEREERQNEQSRSIHFKSVYGMPIKGRNTRLEPSWSVLQLCRASQLFMGCRTYILALLHKTLICGGLADEILYHLHSMAPMICFSDTCILALLSPAGQVLLTEQSSGETKVQLYFTHPVPTLLVQLQIGPFGLETDFRQILKENMASYKQQAEAAAPAGWQQQKQQVAATVKAASDRLQQQVQQPTQVQQGSQQPEQQQQQLGGQLSPPAEPQQQQSAGKQRRSTTSKAAAAAAGEASAAQQQSTPRGRKTTRTRTVSATAAGADTSSSTSSGTPKRRSRMSSSAAAEAELGNGNGTGSADSSSGRKSTARRSTTRRSTKRSSTAAQE
jgi:hypothetical protein